MPWILGNSMRSGRQELRKTFMAFVFVLLGISIECGTQRKETNNSFKNSKRCLRAVLK